jgi:Brp/Blh family beta-carotene 15,15'-monooxygenase
MDPRIRQTRRFAGLAGLTIALWIVVQPDPVRQVWVLAPAVALLGLPHGAMDLPIARRTWPLEGPSGLLRFAAGYLGLAALVVGLWWLLPGVALAGFLAYSAVHFSTDWSDLARPWRFAGGLSSVGAPALLNPDAVTRIFGQLAPVDAASLITPALGLGGVAGLACLAWAMAVHRAPRPFAELAVIWIAAAALPPLVYFVVYFCGLHSPRHLASTLTDLQWDRRALRQAAVVTAVTVVGAGIAAVALATHHAVDAALIKTVFIGLAALTVPHMLLVEHWDRKRTG